MNFDVILELNGDEFVYACYKLILGRAPDDSGLVHYRRRLRRGDSKESILVDLADSIEASGRDNELDLAEMRDFVKKESRWIYRLSLSCAIDKNNRMLDYRLYELRRAVVRDMSDSFERRINTHFIKSFQCIAGGTGAISARAHSGAMSSIVDNYSSFSKLPINSANYILLAALGKQSEKS